MNQRRYRAVVRAALLAPAMFVCALWLIPATGAEASVLSPLPESDYSVRSVCAPPALAEAGCLALELVPETAAARAHDHPLGMARSAPIAAGKAAEGAYGLTPKALHSAYALPLETASSQTVAIIDAYNDPDAEGDLETYDHEFGLPACTTAGGCFQQVNENGESGPANLPFPKSTAELDAALGGTSEESEEAENAIGWSREISLDVQIAHATCQNCHIVLVEAESPSYLNLEAAEDTAARLHATEISNSWGGEPLLGDSPAFEHPGVVITASAGDDGYLNWDAANNWERGYADYPAASPNVVAVGGTRLALNSPGNTWQSETVWNGDGAGGGGCSTELLAQPWQLDDSDWSSVGCGKYRAVADVSADADPYTGVAIYDSYQECNSTHWCTLGGTSLASPLVASVFALAGGSHGVEYPAKTLYENAAQTPASLHDVVSGSNGSCSKHFVGDGLSGCKAEVESKSCHSELICLAGPGYDGPSGVGTPDGLAAFRLPGEEAQPGGESSPGPGSEEGKAEGAGSKGATHEEAEPGGSAAGAGSSGSSSGSTSGFSSTGARLASVGKPAVRLLRLRLTASALAALNRHLPKASQMGFVFTISAAARVHVTLSERVHLRGRARWQPLADSLTIAAAAGNNSRRLHGRNTLAAGHYRLMLAPAQGITRSLTFQIAGGR